MTKFTFANGNSIILQHYAIGNALPARAPSLKAAALLALNEINQQIASDCAVTGIVDDGVLQDLTFENGALLTVPAEYAVTGYRQALEIVIHEIRD